MVYHLISIILIHYQLYDTIIPKDGDHMANGYVETFEIVEKYLKELKSILCSESFTYTNDMDVLLSTVPESTGYKNSDTMDKLKYTKSDIYNTLLSLTVNDYSETLADTKGSTLPPLYVFGKTINTKEVYIKVKIRDKVKNKIFCLAFHFAKFPIIKPYSI